MGNRRIEQNAPSNSVGRGVRALRWIERRQPFGLAALALLAPFAATHGARDFANLPQTATIQIGTLLLLAIGLALRVITARSPARGNPITWPLLAFLAWSGASIGWAHNGYEWLTTWLHWSACGLACLLTFGLVRSLSDARTLIAALFAAAIAVSAVGVAQHWFAVSWFTEIAPPASTFANRNFAAQFLVATWPLGLALLGMRGVRRWLTWSCMLGAAVVFAYLLYTGSRTAWLAVIVQLGVFLLVVALAGGLLVGRRRLILLAAPLGVALVVLAIAAHTSSQGIGWGANALGERATSIATALSRRDNTTSATGQLESPPQRPSSFEVRWAIWLNTLAMIRDHPLLGVGAGNHKVVYPAYAHRVRADVTHGLDKELELAHNDYLQTFAELGAIGVLIAVIGGVIVIVMFARLMRHRLPHVCRLLVLSLGLCLIGIAVSASASSPLQKALPPLVLAICIGMLCALYRNWSPSRKRGVHSRSPVTRAGWRRRLLGVAGLAGVALLLAAVSRFHHQELEASRRYLAAATADSVGDWPGAAREGRRGLSYSPEQRKILLYVGAARLELGHGELAAETYQRVLVTYPYQLNALTGLGFALEAGGRHDAAIRAFARALAVKPDFAMLHAEVATIHLQRGDLPGALAAYRLATRHAPGQTDYHYSHGIVAHQSGRLEEAAAAFGRAVGVAPNFAAGHRDLGVVLYLGLGRRAQGVIHIERALALDPDILGARDLRAILEEYRVGAGAP